ncbi:urea transporter [Streptomyces xanthochromogenes]|uniref:Urea transporter n=1 Tax=Streptomyces xanthochromogenes TaxID=67384 RepID=A0ABQ3A8K9_9ACTN|nr:urea transporter [Streptomyces xanthochromogenes]GGY36752.1 urea transporter [Streptomyces xanthochromogenes]
MRIPRTGRGGLFAVHVLRGQAQVQFMPSAVTGVIFTVALFAAGWQYGLYGLIGTALGTATAQLLGVDRSRVSAGLEGFNACLVAVAFAVFLGPGHPSTMVLAAGGCAVVTVVTAAATTLLRGWGLPTLTLPFCLTASAMTIAAPGFERVWHGGPAAAGPIRAAEGSVALAVDDVGRAFFANIAQIFLMPQWYVGLILLVGIFAASRTAGAMACVGSAVGVVTAWALGAPTARIVDGTMGYNAVLVAMALCGVLLAADRWSLGFAMAGAAAATVLGPALNALLEPAGGHSFTWPFVLTTLVFLASVPALPRLRRAAPPTVLPLTEPVASGVVLGA